MIQLENKSGIYSACERHVVIENDTWLVFGPGVFFLAVVEETLAEVKQILALDYILAINMEQLLTLMMLYVF